MIQIQRPSVIPAVLRNQGVVATLALCAAYDANPAAYVSGAITFPDFDPKIYRHPEVKNALCEAQNDKCCFCESRVTHIAYGNVEHFRPKKAFVQRRGDPLNTPGYYWLAYEWTNLFLCCDICNQKYKQNLFPLRNPGRRARSHRDSVAAERPLFINPEEDPSPYLRFHREIVCAYRNNRRGRATIDGLGLNRVELVEKRQDRLKDVKALTDSKGLLAKTMRQAKARNAKPPSGYSEQVAKIDARLAELSSDAEYAAMVRAALR
jgi:uncharacterized protein (TIGR02646 family)